MDSKQEQEIFEQELVTCVVCNQIWDDEELLEEYYHCVGCHQWWPRDPMNPGCMHDWMGCEVKHKKE
jgi:hypothetical protein